MPGTRKLSIEVVGDARGVSKAFGEIDSDAGRAEGRMSKMGAAGSVAMLGVVGAAAGAAVALGKMTQAAMADEAEQAVYEKQILLAGGSQQVIDAMDEQIAAGMRLKGFTDTELRTSYAQAYAQSGDFAQSQADVALAMDIARKAGVPLEKAMDAVTKAQNGNEAALKKLMPEYGAMIDGAGGAEQALLLVKDATAGMSEEFANTTQGRMERAKMQMGELGEQIGGVLIPAMNAILPVVTEVGAWIGENLPKAMAVVKTWVDANWPKIRDAITEALEFVSQYVRGFVSTVTGLWEQHGDRIMSVVMITFDYVRSTIDNVMKVVRGIIDVVMGVIRGDWSQAWDGIKQILSGVWDQIINYVGYATRIVGVLLDLAWEGIKAVARAAWGAVVDYVKWYIGSIVDFVTALPGRIVGVIGTLWDGLKTGITAAKDWVGDRIDDVVGFAKGLPARMVGIFSGMWDGIKTAFRGALNWVIDAWNGLEFSLPSISAFGKTVGGQSIGTPNIGRLHAGGTVGGGSFAGMSNDEVAAILLKGETVLTRGQTSSLSSGSGSRSNVYNINVAVPPTVDSASIGRVIIRAIIDSEQVDGTAWRAS